MNEIPLGFDWPSAEISVERITEAIQIINSLWNNTKSLDNSEKFSNIDSKINNNQFVQSRNIFKHELHSYIFTAPAQMRLSLSDYLQIIYKMGDAIFPRSMRSNLSMLHRFGYPNP
jgi:hypothetical protein